MVTIKEIAKEANVSVMTVSNVINKRTSKVSKETIEKIETIIKNNNYIPNMNARSLVNESSKLIAFLIYENTMDTHKSLFGDPFISEFLIGMDEVFKSNGYYLLMQSVASMEEIKLLIHKWNLDGAIILGLLKSEVKVLKASVQIPVILIDCYPDEEIEGIYCVGIDDRLGAKWATEHLIANGHSRIGFASYRIHLGGVVEQRLQGYNAALLENGLVYDDRLLFALNDEIVDVKHLLSHILANKDQMTAIVCSADIIAIELMEYMKMNGVSIPDQLSIVGFDDIKMSKFVSPKLTTVYQNIEMKGREAASMILDRLHLGQSEKQMYREVPITLVTRESVKRLL
jgi:DNA-binding LacI/PurR family transcriptional regulator